MLGHAHWYRHHASHPLRVHVGWNLRTDAPILTLRVELRAHVCRTIVTGVVVIARAVCRQIVVHVTRAVTEASVGGAWTG